MKMNRINTPLPAALMPEWQRKIAIVAFRPLNGFSPTFAFVHRRQGYLWVTMLLMAHEPTPIAFVGAGFLQRGSWKRALHEMVQFLLSNPR